MTTVTIQPLLPTNNPAPTGITVTQNQNGSVDILLSFTYTQSATVPADGLMLFYKVGGTSTVTKSDAAIQLPVGATSYLFSGVAQDVTGRIGIAAYRNTASGIAIGPIQQPTSTPDWRVNGSTANITANIAGTPASTVLLNISNAATTATWSGVTGSGKPADNATYNPGIFANLDGKITPSNYATYMDAGAVTSVSTAFSNTSLTSPGTRTLSITTTTDGNPVILQALCTLVGDVGNTYSSIQFKQDGTAEGGMRSATLPGVSVGAVPAVHIRPITSTNTGSVTFSVDFVLGSGSSGSLQDFVFSVTTLKR